MAGPGAWLSLALVAPLVLFLPGYLILGLTSTRSGRAELAEGAYETAALSVAISLSIVVLLGYVLSQTVGLSRWTILLAFASLLAGLGLLSRAYGPTDEDEGTEEGLALGWPLGSPGASPGSGLPSRHLPAMVLGVTLALVAAGALVYDGSEPYSEAYYEDASGVSPLVTVDAGEEVAWTLVVENHEQETTAYRIETALIPNGSVNSSDPPRVSVDEAGLELAAGANGTRSVGFQAPDGGVWKVQTTVHADASEDPLTVHRWIEVR